MLALVRNAVVELGVAARAAGAAVPVNVSRISSS